MFSFWIVECGRYVYTSSHEVSPEIKSIFKQKSPDVIHQGRFKFAFRVIVGQVQKIEGVLILYRKDGLFSYAFGKGSIIIGLAQQVLFIGLIVYLIYEYIF
jgi:hypothetical protein